MPSRVLGGTRNAAGSGGAAAPELPALAGLKYHLKADSLGTADGTPVTTWVDSGSGGFNATQATASMKPTKQTVGGKSVVRFDGIDDRLEQVNGAFPWGSASTMFIVMQSTDADFAVLSSQGSGGASGMYYARGPGLVAAGGYGFNKVGVHMSYSTTYTFDASLRVYTAQDDGSAIQNYQNGAALAMTTVLPYGATANSSQPCGIGVRTLPGPTYDFYMAGDIAEIICYSRSLTAAERDQVTDYLGQKYGLTVATGPAAIANLARWFKADTLALADGTPVTTWNDSSASPLNATQATAAQKPTYKTGIVNGKPVVRFDGTDDNLQMASAAFPWGTRFTFFVVMQSTDTDFVVFGGQNGGASGVTLSFGPTIHGGAGRWGPYYLGLSWAYVTTVLFNSAFHVYSLADATSTMDAYQDGGTRHTPTLGAWGPSSLDSTIANAIGARNVGGSGLPFDLFLTGDIAEIVLYSRYLTAAERSDVTSYLGSKYGITVV